VSRDASAVAAFLCDNAALHGETIKDTLYFYIVWVMFVAPCCQDNLNAWKDVGNDGTAF
jgi:hypothetical protein